MRLVNRSRGVVLAETVERATSALARMRGLLGRDALAPGAALVIDPCTSVHTFFMRFPIDVAFLDGRGRVLRAIRSLPPWRATRIYFRARLAVELPSGTLARSGTSSGDILDVG